MIRIIIEGPQGAGKTALGNIVGRLLLAVGYDIELADDLDELSEQGAVRDLAVSWRHRIEITTRQPGDEEDDA